jgi:hypothetical protein
MQRRKRSRDGERRRTFVTVKKKRVQGIRDSEEEAEAGLYFLY